MAGKDTLCWFLQSKGNTEVDLLAAQGTSSGLVAAVVTSENEIALDKTLNEIRIELDTDRVKKIMLLDV